METTLNFEKIWQLFQETDKKMRALQELFEGQWDKLVESLSGRRGFGAPVVEAWNADQRYLDPAQGIPGWRELRVRHHCPQRQGDRRLWK